MSIVASISQAKLRFLTLFPDVKVVHTIFHTSWRLRTRLILSLGSVVRQVLSRELTFFENLSTMFVDQILSTLPRLVRRRWMDSFDRYDW